jgi:hypothetical protein
MTSSAITLLGIYAAAKTVIVIYRCVLNLTLFTVLSFVQIHVFNNESGFHQRLFANASDDTVVVHNIAKDGSYHVRLLAYNRMGDGVLSEDVIIGAYFSKM